MGLSAHPDYNQSHNLMGRCPFPFQGRVASLKPSRMIAQITDDGFDGSDRHKGVGIEAETV